MWYQEGRYCGAFHSFSKRLSSWCIMIKSEFHFRAKARHINRVSLHPCCWVEEGLQLSLPCCWNVRLSVLQEMLWEVYLLSLGGSRRGETWCGHGFIVVTGQWHWLQVEISGHKKALGWLSLLAFSQHTPARKALWWQAQKLHSCENPSVGSLLVFGTMYLDTIRLWKRGCLILIASYSSLLSFWQCKQRKPQSNKMFSCFPFLIRVTVNPLTG